MKLEDATLVTPTLWDGEKLVPVVCSNVPPTKRDIEEIIRLYPSAPLGEWSLTFGKVKMLVSEEDSR